MDCCPLLPTATLPNAAVVGLAAKVAPAAIPFPESTRVCGEPGALSVNVMLPVAVPVAAGVNCVLKVRFWPAGMVVGSERPLTPKPLPETVARFITTLALPVLVNVTVCVPVCPTITLPKLTDAGEIARPGCIPVPLKVTTRGEFVASLATVRLPVAAPAAAGAN